MCEIPATATNGRSGLVSQPREATATSPRRALRPTASRPQAKRAWPTASPTPPPICSGGPPAPRHPPPHLPYHPAPPKIAPIICCPSNSRHSPLFAQYFSFNYYKTISKDVQSPSCCPGSANLPPRQPAGFRGIFVLTRGFAASRLHTLAMGMSPASRAR